MDEETKETLKKQLQLLSERSKELDSDLPALTHAMVEIAKLLNAGRFIPEDSHTVNSSQKCCC